MGQLPKGDRQGSRRALEVLCCARCCAVLCCALLSCNPDTPLCAQVALDAITAEYVGNPSSALKEQKQVLEENLAVIR